MTAIHTGEIVNGHAFSGMREADLKRLVHDYHYFT